MKYYTYTLSLLVVILVSCRQSSQVNKEELISGEKENYNWVKYEPILLSDQLPKKVDEQSGMIWHNDLIWVNNDSGGAATLYAYNKNGELKQQLHIEGGSNLDWEALAEDEKYFYIGEFGNNNGTRKNLKVFRVDKSKINDKPEVSIKADEIGFTWADQKEFKRKKHNHNFDCEAFLSYGDSLYFFTKNWENHKTRMYVMEKSVKHHDLSPKAEFDTDFMVTGADISRDGKIVALIGYKNYRTYMILFFNFLDSDFFGGKYLRLDLSSLGGAQTEGVVFTDDNELLINTEATKQAQAVYKIDWKQLIKN
ncbi:hypothetical protein [Marinifilum sp. D737]|uniref:hypothetical protein n=1 Tax=Marinifilum sp. D737 TaxID=2969628 RepID=UPI002272EE52|nr:hypothetical protein [Marinifilum sp. D737]MCY1635043.1 hypothetical protein [Marinifilum sp. D737]